MFDRCSTVSWFAEMRFSSSGREDIDVRMLGEGRPFVLEIINPHRTKFSPEEYAAMQSKINASTNLVRVHDLQRIGKYATVCFLLT